jgi:hypothetical protein
MSVLLDQVEPGLRHGNRSSKAALVHLCLWSDRRYHEDRSHPPVERPPATLPRPQTQLAETIGNGLSSRILTS